MGLLLRLSKALSREYTAREVLERVYSELGKTQRATKVDLTDNKDQRWRGGRIVDFSWQDEHRWNTGWFRYPEMQVFERAGQLWAVGVGLAEGGYTMNCYHTDLRMFPVPEGEELVASVTEAFGDEDWFKSTVLVAEDTFHKRGRLYFPYPSFYDGRGWKLEELRWHNIIGREGLRTKLPKECTFEFEGSSIVLECGPGKQNPCKYTPAEAIAIKETILHLIDTQEQSESRQGGE